MIHNELITKLFRAWMGKLSALPDGESSALVLMADGCGGLDLGELGLRHAMRKGGPASVRFRPVRWGHGVGHWHADLTDADNHEAGAAMMAEEVRAWREERPGVPVFMVGKSGGAWIVTQALERLPAEAVEVAVLLAPAMSPTRDLSRALRAVRREMVVIWSPLDALVLGAGTWLFGTADRVRSVSAGMVGFRTPPGLDGDGQAQYRKLRQVRWRAAMAASGHLGGHVGPDNPAFLRKYVLPLLGPEAGVKS